jgi:hypothetical protein
MASLKAVQKRVPGADTVAGRVIAFVNGKHYDLGEYVGEGAVVLSKDGEKLMAPKPLPQKPIIDVTLEEPAAASQGG